MPNVCGIKECATFIKDREHEIAELNKLTAKQGGDVTWLLTLSDAFPSLCHLCSPTVFIAFTLAYHCKG